ncbi:MAG: hypothetical protein QME12_01325 [Nanoarchaeota archaeon]|nr:hypothetical protein [Nanoarchaeota archaeon]
MDIYMFNTGSQYTLYYNPQKVEDKEKPKIPAIDLAKRINLLEGILAGNTTKEYRITADVQAGIDAAYDEIIYSAKKSMHKIGNRMKTKTSGILKEAAYAGTASLNYSENIPEDKAKRIFSRIVKKEAFKSGLILGIEAISFAAFFVPPLLFVPFTSFILGPAIVYQIAIMRALSKGVKNISFAPSPEVSKLERIISGEKGLGLTNPDLIEYRAAKGL